MNKRFLVLLSLAASVSAFAGSFDKYKWNLGFLPAQGYYQVTLKITYDYRSEGGLDPSVLALPNDTNLKLQRLVFKVDGQKVDPIEAELSTYWSHGKPTNTWLPSQEGKRIKAEAFYVIKNIFLIPPAPTNLPVPVARLDVGFSPVQGFDLTYSFIGESYRLKGKKIAARVGDPNHRYSFVRKNVPAATHPELMFLIPKTFSFSFNALRGKQMDPKVSAGTGAVGALLGGTGGYNAGRAGAGDLDAAAGEAGFSMTGDLKPYSANFYKGNPMRDWRFALTWLQQDTTYLPFGIDPGGRVKSRTLFPGSGDKEDDLIPWIDAPKKLRGDAVVESDEYLEISDNPDVNEATGAAEQVELFLADFRGGLVIDRKMSRLVATAKKDGRVSPAMANRELANQLHNRFGLKAVPALTSIFPQDRIAALPLSAFDGVITAVQIGKNWFFVDAANPNWSLERSILFLRGHSVIILEQDNIQMGAF